MNWKWLRSIVSKMIVAMLNIASPEIRDDLEGSIAKLYEKAKKTNTPIDDVIVKMIAELLGVELTESE